MCVIREHHRGGGRPVQRLGFLCEEALVAPAHERFLLAPLPLRGGSAQYLDAYRRAALVACLRQQPDATLDEYGGG